MKKRNTKIRFHFTAIISFLNVPSLYAVELNTETPCIFESHKI